MGRSADRALRWFVGLSLLAGGLVLLAGAVLFGTLGGPIWVIPLAGVVAAVLALPAAGPGGGPPSPVPTPAPRNGSGAVRILLAPLPSPGHPVPEGFAADAPVGTGNRI